MNAAATLPNGAALVDKLKANPRLPMMLGGAALVAAIAVGVMWSRQPDYKVLYTNLSERDGGAVIQSLQQMNVPYKFAEGGGVVAVGHPLLGAGEQRRVDRGRQPLLGTALGLGDGLKPT